MMRNVQILPIGLIIALAALLTACPWDDFTEIHDRIDYHLIPQNDTLHVGDTLWVSTTFDDYFEFIEDGSSITYNGTIHLLMDLYLVKKNADPLTGSDMIYGADNFHIVERVGQVNGITQLTPEFSDKAYRLEFGLVAVNPGLYLLDAGIGSLYETNHRYLLSSFSVADNHRALVDSSLHSTTNFIKNSDYLGVTNRTYSFVVK